MRSIKYTALWYLWFSNFNENSRHAYNKCEIQAKTNQNPTKGAKKSKRKSQEEQRDKYQKYAKNIKKQYSINFLLD